MAPRASNSRRRPCYANSRLPLLRRLRWVRPHWRRHRLLLFTVGGMAAAGTAVAGTTAGAAPASLSAALFITPAATAAATCAGWSQPPGDPAGARAIAATEPT